VFWINLPIGAVTFVMFGLFLHEHRVPHRHRIDYLGSALMMFGAGALMLALVQVGNSGEFAMIVGLAAAALRLCGLWPSMDGRCGTGLAVEAVARSGHRRR